MLKIQLKNMSRDKVIIISIFLPIVIALILKFFTPTSLIIEPKIGIVSNNLSESIITELSHYTQVITFDNIDKLKNRIMVANDEVTGIVYNEITQKYSILLQGNETKRTKDRALLLTDIKSNINDNYFVEVLPSATDSIKQIIATIVVIIAFYMGSTLITFSIVAEKEEGIINIFKVTPMTKTKLISQKILLGFFVTLIVSTITSLIIINTNQLLILILFIAISSLSAVSLGLYLGRYSKDLIAAIINTKVVLLVFIFVPFIVMLMPNNLAFVKNLFYILPSYPMFKGVLNLYSNGSNQEILLCIFVITVHVAVSYYMYFKKELPNKIDIA